MDYWIDGWMDGWKDGWIDGWIAGYGLGTRNFHIVGHQELTASNYVTF